MSRKLNHLKRLTVLAAIAATSLVAFPSVASAGGSVGSSLSSGGLEDGGASTNALRRG